YQRDELRGTSAEPSTALQGVRALMDAIILVLAVAAMGLLCVYRLRKLRIAEFAGRATQGSRSQHDAAFALGRAMFGGVKRRGRDPAFLTPLLAPLGATPTTIL